MSQPVWLEVALNGPWGRDTHPGIPIAPEEIIKEAVACAHEGAAIVHLHAYDVVTGRQRDDADLYARIIEGIHSQVDVIVYPTLPFVGSADQAEIPSATERFQAVEILARRGLLEWAVVDPGSANIALLDDIRMDKGGFVYTNPDSHLRYGLHLAQRYGFSPSYAIYEPGFLRLGATWARRYPSMPRAIYRFMFSDQFSFGFPPEPYALDAYLKLLAAYDPDAPWMIAGLGVNLDGLISYAAERGGHIRVGLEDAPLTIQETNASLVRSAAHRLARDGYSLASPGHVRTIMRSES